MTATAGRRARGLVGLRALACVQTLDIGRLTADPVYLVPGGLIAVTGQGPLDSNQSSKTTLEAAVSLLLGDPGWNQESHQFTSYALELLFDPPNAPRGVRVAAEVGYIVGVFAQLTPPGGSFPATGAEAVTVWVRLDRHADPPLQATLGKGVLLATGATHAERLADAARIWAGLPRPRLGPRRYARELYGPGVACLSYVSCRGGRVEPRDRTLLGADISQLSPEQIAAQLIDLAGMRGLFTAEADQRRAFFALQQTLRAKQRAVGQAGGTVAACQSELAVLQDAIAMVKAARGARDRHVAQTILEALTELAGLAHQLTQRQQEATAAQTATDEVARRLAGLETGAAQARHTAALAQVHHAQQQQAPLAERRRRLDGDLAACQAQLDGVGEAADGWRGRRSGQVAAELAEVTEQLAQVRDAVAVARGRCEQAAAHLDAVRRGTGGVAAQRLRAHGITCQLLGDTVELAGWARDRFEPLLHPFADGLCVAPEQLAAAMEKVADLPGTLLIGAPETALPDGVLAAPPGAAGLLAWLHTHSHPRPHGAVLEGMLAVVAGFPDPRIGHAARVAAATRALRDAQAGLDPRTRRLEDLTRTQQGVREEHAAAQAHQQQAALAEQLAGLRGQLAGVTDQLAPLEAALAQARTGEFQAAAAVQDLAERRTQTTAHLTNCRVQLRHATQALTEVGQQARGYRLDAWLSHLQRPASGRPPADVPWQECVGAARRDPLGLPDHVTEAVRAAARALAGADAGVGYRDQLTRLEARLGLEVAVTVGRNESTTAHVTSRHGELETTLRLALERYHAAAAVVDRRRARPSEEREIVALDHALDAVDADLGRQAEQTQAAVTRAQATYTQQRREYDEAADELTATDANLRNLQRGLEHQVRGLFERVSEEFNQLRWRDGGYGGTLAWEVKAPGLDAPPPADPETSQPDTDAAQHRWLLTATPQWARRPPEAGPPQHVDYRKQANTAQYKLATVQLVLAALLANQDPAGRLLILDELGDGLGDTHRQRVLDALRRAATQTGITVLVTVQDDLQAGTFDRCAEVLLLRYASDRDLLNEPTRMFASNPHRDPPAALVSLADALTSHRGPGWSALLSVFTPTPHPAPAAPSGRGHDGQPDRSGAADPQDDGTRQADGRDEATTKARGDAG